MQVNVVVVVVVDKKIGRKYPTKQISKNNNNNDVPEGTTDQVYSAVVSPITKSVS
jgi:hypothetical protein